MCPTEADPPISASHGTFLSMISSFDNVVHELIQTLLEHIGTMMTSDEAVAGSICSNKSVEFFKGLEPTSNCDEALQQNLRMIL